MYLRFSLKSTVAVILFGMVALPATGQLRISRSTLVSASGRVHGGSYAATVSVGQPAGGTSDRISLGFWPGTVDDVSTSIESFPDTALLPTAFRLTQNYPNPFNPSTRIRFDLPSPEWVRLDVFDSLGRMVASLVNEQLGAASHEVIWRTSGLPSGVYFYRFESGRYLGMKSMVLLN